MLLDIYLWLWPRMSLRYLLRRGGYLLALAALALGPLLYLNIDLIRQGFKPSQAGLRIEADGGSRHYSGIHQLPAEE